MRGIGRVKRFLGEKIAANRRSATVQGLHAFASFVETAYANVGSDFYSDGENVLLQKLVPSGFQVAVDAGANIGDWSSAALGAWPQCRVHAFEVAPRTFQILTETISPEHRTRATLNCLGLSDEAGKMEMFYYPEHPELTCDLPRHVSYEAVRFDADMDTGDRYCDRAGIDGVDFLKIDVEGAESRVLRGFGRRIAQQKIHCIQFEYGAFATQTKFLLTDYYSMLGEHYWIGKIYPRYVEFRDYDWTMEDFRFGNYCCVSKSRMDLRDLLAE